MLACGPQAKESLDMIVFLTYAASTTRIIVLVTWHSAQNNKLDRRYRLLVSV